MSRITKEKRTHLILVTITTLAVGVGLWTTLIRAQQQSLQGLKDQQTAKETKQEQIRDTVKNKEQIEKDLVVMLRKLELLEEDMAAGDLYASMYTAIRKFKPAYKVEIPEIKCSGVPTEMDLLADFPYKQVAVTISGTAYYFDLGRFVGDFENRFPNSRIINIDMSPTSAVGAEEKLAFRLDIISLVKPSAAHPAGK